MRRGDAGAEPEEGQGPASGSAWEAVGRSLGFICRERPSPNGLKQGSDTVRFVL